MLCSRGDCSPCGILGFGEATDVGVIACLANSELRSEPGIVAHFPRQGFDDPGLFIATAQHIEHPLVDGQHFVAPFSGGHREAPRSQSLGVVAGRDLVGVYGHGPLAGRRQVLEGLVRDFRPRVVVGESIDAVMVEFLEVLGRPAVQVPASRFGHAVVDNAPHLGMAESESVALVHQQPPAERFVQIGQNFQRGSFREPNQAGGVGSFEDRNALEDGPDAGRQALQPPLDHAGHAGTQGQLRFFGRGGVQDGLTHFPR